MTEQPSPGDSAPDASTPDATPVGDTPPPDDALTESGYSYTVVDDAEPGAEPFAAAPPSGRGGGAPSPVLLAALAIVPAVVVGVLVWVAVAVLMGGSDSASRAEQDVGNVLNIFSQGQTGAVVSRYENSLAPGFPADMPTYPGAKIVASVVQIADGDANYLVVYDTGDSRADVGAFLTKAFGDDPWQLAGGQDGDASTLHRFSKIDDADITGLALSANSQDNNLTTIVYSVQIVSGGKAAADDRGFDESASKSLPDGFPDEIEAYPDGIVIESAFQKEAQASTYSISVITKDSVSDVLDFYRESFGGTNWTVKDEDASQAPLANAEGLSFTSEDPAISGAIIAGEFARDDAYTQVEVQVAVTE